jgi:hypothetical protein
MTAVEHVRTNPIIGFREWCVWSQLLIFAQLGRKSVLGHTHVVFSLLVRAARGPSSRVRKQKTDRQDAQLILALVAGRSLSADLGTEMENRDRRQLLWHRPRMVKARARIMNQLQAVALNEDLRCQKRLWQDAGRDGCTRKTKLHELVSTSQKRKLSGNDIALSTELPSNPYLVSCLHRTGGLPQLQSCGMGRPSPWANQRIKPNYRRRVLRLPDRGAISCFWV